MAGYLGKQGRKPKATTIAEMQRDSYSDTVMLCLPEAPTHLTDREKEEWTRAGEQLLHVGLIGELDTTVLAAYCVAYGRWVESQELIKKHGVLVKSPSGFPMQSPYLAISNKSMEQMIKLMGELGMTPASRTRIPRKEQPRQQRNINTQTTGADPRGILGVVK